MRLSMLSPTSPHPGLHGATMGNLISFESKPCPVGGEFDRAEIWELRMRSGSQRPRVMIGDVIVYLNAHSRRLHLCCCPFCFHFLAGPKNGQGSPSQRG